MTHHPVPPSAVAEISDVVPRLPDVGVWEHRLPENQVLVSDGFCHLVGLEPSAVTPNLEFWNERIHPADDYLNAYNAFVQGRTAEYHALYRIRHEKGHWVSVLARAHWERRHDGEGQLARGYVMDVTWSERVKLQAEIIERMSEGVVLLSRDGTVQFANSVAEATLGFGMGQLTGVDSHQLSFRSREAYDGMLQTAFAATENGSSALMDLESRRRDGTLLPLQARVSALKLGSARYVIVVFTDVSMRRQFEREMMQMATQVQQRVGGDLHEGLGQQLSGIAMTLQALGARALAAAPSLAVELNQVVAQLNDAVSRTRTLARGLSPVRASERGLREGFEELVHNMRELYDRQVHLDLDLPTDLSVDDNCATALFHIAQEAVENAVRHAEARDIRITFRADGSELELQVTDDGVGFDLGHAAPVGMGLRMMRFRAEMAHGYLSIDSRPGHGARLRCRCPARTDQHA